MLSRYRIAYLAAAIAVASPLSADAQQTSIKPDSSGYVAANGVNYWFEIHGKGEPLVLLHGGLTWTQAFGPMLAELAKHRRVIGIDLQGHGHTTLGDRKKVDPVDIGRDLATVVQKLGLRQVDAMGYSFGGMVALQFAIQNPTIVRKLVVVSTPFSRTGWYAEMLPQQAAVGAAMADQMKDTPMYKGYAAIAPRPQDFPRLLDAMGVLMRTDYDWSAQIKQLPMPVMLVYGDADMVRPEHMVEFYHLLGGGLRDAGWQRENMSKNRLAIIPDRTHYDIGDSVILAETVLPFLTSASSGSPR
jgi:pimeloyl-ACP methyl ester carboxylesterase